MNSIRNNLKKTLLSILSFILILTLLTGFAMAVPAGHFEITPATGWTYAGNVLTIETNGAYTITMAAGVTSTTTDRIVVASGVTAHITLDNVSIDRSGTSGACAFDMTGATVYLTIVGVNTLKSGLNRAGLEVPASSTLTTGGTLSDKITVTGGNSGAGIGGGNLSAGGVIIINGGEVEAHGGSYSAGIGGGADGAGGTIIINGGEVEAKGGNNGAGIGGGADGAGGTIIISGGKTKTVGSNGGAGIGGGDRGACGTITISNGRAEAVGSNGSAGIGGGNWGANGTITISGGEVEAWGGNNGAGIGGGYQNDGGIITIGGGEVEARGGNNGAGIGGGAGSDGGLITIISGKVAAEGGRKGAGIGGGEKGTGGTITIRGGEVKAVGDTDGAGIGGGWQGAGGTITISDGKIEARGGNNGAGIGGGAVGAGGTITISGGEVEAFGNAGIGWIGVSGGGAGIGGGGYYGDGGIITISGGIVTASSQDRALGGTNETVILPTATYTYWTNTANTDPGDFGTFIPPELAFTNSYDHKFVKIVSPSRYLSITGGIEDTDYTYIKGVLKIIEDGDYTITMAPGVTSTTTDRIIIDSGVEANITLKDVLIDVSETGGSAFSITNSTVNLTIIGENTFKSGSWRAGLAVPKSSVLIIDGSGSLNANGGSGGAGIGGGYGDSGGTITINGGIVGANGGTSGGGHAGINGGAGIGGGGCGFGEICDGGTITINGGIVEANGNDMGAGIGGGGSGGPGGPSGIITINGGVVRANGSGEGSGIGGGGGVSHIIIGPTSIDGTIKITGGTVIATSPSGKALGSSLNNTTIVIPPTSWTDMATNLSGKTFGSLGETIILPTATYTYWTNTANTDPGGSGMIAPPNSFINSNDYKFVKIVSPDLSIPETPSGPILPDGGENNQDFQDNVKTESMPITMLLAIGLLFLVAIIAGAYLYIRKKK